MSFFKGLCSRFSASMHRGTDGDSPLNLVISLTSFPPRVPLLHRCVESLLKQHLKPNRLLLWLAKEEFPRREKELPRKLLKLKDRGLEILWTNNTKPYKKLISTLVECPDSHIATADDDAVYPEDWLDNLWTTYLADDHDKGTYGHRLGRITLDSEGNINPYLQWPAVSNFDKKKSYLNFCTGLGGVLYPKHVLHPKVLDIDLAFRIAPTNDDVFFWAMTVLNHKKIALADTPCDRIDIEYKDSPKLYNINVEQNMNDVYIKNVLREFPEILDLVRAEQREDPV